MINELPENSVFSLGGVGNSQLMITSLAVVTGCGARIGLEDNIWYDSERTKFATNTELLTRLRTIVESTGSSIMKPSQGRELLGLKTSSEGYGLRDD